MAKPQVGKTIWCERWGSESCNASRPLPASSVQFFTNHFYPFLHCANQAATEDLGLAMRNAGVLNAKSSKRQSTKFESRLAPAPCHNFSLTASRELYIKELESINNLTCQRCQGRPGWGASYLRMQRSLALCLSLWHDSASLSTFFPVRSWLSWRGSLRRPWPKATLANQFHCSLFFHGLPSWTLSKNPGGDMGCQNWLYPPMVEPFYHFHTFDHVLLVGMHLHGGYDRDRTREAHRNYIIAPHTQKIHACMHIDHNL